MSNYVSSQMKGFKKTQFLGLRKHHVRTIVDDKNVYPELSCGNVYIQEVVSFANCEKRMKKLKEAAGKRTCNIEFSKNSNAFVDNVVVLSRDQVMVVKSKYPFNWKDKIIDCCKKLANFIHKNFGLFPMAIDLHVDEGHFKSEEFIENFHVHMTFFNFDFEKLIHPFRLMGKGNMKKLQDLTGRAFIQLGFVRGKSKELTSAVHKDKAEYLEALVERLKAALESLNASYSQVEKELSVKLIKLSGIESKIIDQESNFRKEECRSVSLKKELIKTTSEINRLRLVKKQEEINYNDSKHELMVAREDIVKLNNHLKKIKRDINKTVLNSKSENEILYYKRLERARLENELTVIEGKLLDLRKEYDEVIRSSNPTERALRIKLDFEYKKNLELTKKLDAYEGNKNNSLEGGNNKEYTKIIVP
ncbi:hypothetical protein L1D11_07835 [Vibrio sp. Isolate32]|uniref:hypothetical protein n=1 Tax=Vibrio sp. Isolate32 TaxID=2908538 RepID=UPI001EFEE7C6|nr:hypothetical protein [Vibrio sp. Isolate32]MCG9553295.1 hypothetical protein [Vibrio sp. Isolate32]